MVLSFRSARAGHRLCHESELGDEEIRLGNVRRRSKSRSSEAEQIFYLSAWDSISDLTGILDRAK